MVEFQFVGDVSELSEEQKGLIVNVVKERGFENVNINVQPVGEAGDNYVANVKRITMEKDGEAFKIIAKVAPRNEMIRSLGNTHLIFRNEHVMYSEVLPKFTELEKAATIPEENRLRYATCYGTYLEPPNEIILLEDLCVPGFKMLDRFISLTDDNVRLILKNFAMLHSLSYALKDQEPETFDKLCASLVNIYALMVDVPEIVSMYDNFDADVQLLFDEEKYKNALGNISAQFLPRVSELVKIEASSKFSVVHQGDPWTNNIMFRLENDKTVECCLIDYQLSKLSSPVADLHYMVFTSTDYATRKKYYHDWIDYYHSQLDESLANFGLNIDVVYPRNQFDADLKLYSKVALAQAVLLATVLVRESKDAAKMKEVIDSLDENTNLDEIAEQTKMSALDSVTKKKFKARVEGVVDTFIECGYL